MKKFVLLIFLFLTILLIGVGALLKLTGNFINAISLIHQQKIFIYSKENSLPEKIGEAELKIEAEAAIIIDYKSKKILFEKNPEKKLAPASLTKIMTAILVLEKANLEDVIICKKPILEMAKKAEYKMDLKEGEKIKAKDLLFGLLINSAGDAAYVLADWIGKGTDNFVKLMNQKAKTLNLLNTNFKNPSGTDEPNHFSTAKDLAFLSLYALENETFREIVKTKEKTVCSIDKTICHHLKQTNLLLGEYENYKILGVKTGKTKEAGGCLISFAENKKGNKIVTVILNSKNRFEETKKMIEWTFSNFKW